MSDLDSIVSLLRRATAALSLKVRSRRDKWLHPSRHRRAKEMLRTASRLRSILVVCHGNVCRSPYLAAVLQRALPDIEITSAGLVGPGRSVPAYGQDVALKNGLDLSRHRSRVLTWDILRGADLVIVMEEGQARYLTRGLRFSNRRVVIAGDLDPMTDGRRGIHDPWQQPLDVFEASYARLDRCAGSLVGVLSARAG